MTRKLLLILLLCIGASRSFAQTQPEETAVRFLGFLQTNADSAYAMLDTSVQKLITPFHIKQAWSSIEFELGKFSDTDGVLVETGKVQTVYLGCRFKKATMDLATSINSNGKIVSFYIRPPVSKIPYSVPPYFKENTFKEIPVLIKNGSYELPGILTLPNKKADVPLVVFGHGSGPNTRDERIGPNRIFKDMAIGLAVQGVASFRFDKRTNVYGNASAVHPDSLTVWEECIDDLVYIADTFSHFPGIQHDRIFLLGHSLSGYLAPRIAIASGKYAGIILAAGPARPIEDLLLEQMVYLQSLDSSDDLMYTIENLKEETDYLHSADFNAESDASFLPLNLNAAYWLDLKGYDPVATAASLRVPVLVLQGAKDYQVTLTDYYIWEKTFKGKKGFRFILYPDLNHAFLPDHGLYGPAQYEIAGNVPFQVMKDIARFVK